MVQVHPPVLTGCEKTSGVLPRWGGTPGAALRRLFRPMSTLPRPYSSRQGGSATVSFLSSQNTLACLLRRPLCGRWSRHPVRATVPSHPVCFVLSFLVFLFICPTSTSTLLCVRCVFCASLLQGVPRKLLAFLLPKVLSATASLIKSVRRLSFFPHGSLPSSSAPAGFAHSCAGFLFPLSRNWLLPMVPGLCGCHLAQDA